jgi:hypothetical protein
LNPSDNKKKRYKPAERVSLTPSNVVLVDKLLSQVRASLPELKLSKTDLINWLLKSHADKLTDRELAAIERDYFDPVKALEAAIAEARKQQGMGEQVDVQALLNEKCLLKKRRSTKRKPVRNLKEAANQTAVKASLD